MTPTKITPTFSEPDRFDTMAWAVVPSFRCTLPGNIQFALIIEYRRGSTFYCTDAIKNGWLELEVEDRTSVAFKRLCNADIKAHMAELEEAYRKMAPTIPIDTVSAIVRSKAFQDGCRKTRRDMEPTTEEMNRPFTI